MPGNTENTFQIADILRVYAQMLGKPVVGILIIFILCAAILVGWILAELFTEHRHLKIKLPQLMDEIRSGTAPLAECISGSGLLKSQKEALLELTRHPDFTPDMREALAVRLIESQQSKYDKIIKASELLSRLAPMFGLMGTLIPLGPGIIALGQGDTRTLSSSMLMAFDTTITGLSVAAVAAVISTVRRIWYREYMSILEVLSEAVLEMQKDPAALPEMKKDLAALPEMKSKPAAVAGAEEVRI